MYKVINRFQEKSHGDHVYEIGEPYPAEGKKLVKSRADSLTKVHNEYGVAFLEVMEEPRNPTANQSIEEPSVNEGGTK